MQTITVEKVLEKTTKNGAPYLSVASNKVWYNVFEDEHNYGILNFIRGSEGNCIQAEVTSNTIGDKTFYNIVSAGPTTSATQTANTRPLPAPQPVAKSAPSTDPRQESIEAQNRLTNAVNLTIAMIVPGKTTNKDVEADLGYFYNICLYQTHPERKPVDDPRTGIYDTDIPRTEDPDRPF